MQQYTELPTAHVGGRRLAALCLAALYLAAPTGARDSHREHGAHEHGAGVLNVVVEANELAIELRMPGVNVVGFEHAPSNEADRAAIDKVLAIFRDPSRLFVADKKAKCEVAHVNATIGPPGGARDEHGKHGDHEDNGQDDAKAHDEDEAARHTELNAEYHFQCAAPQHLKHLEVRAFEHLIDVDELDAQVVTDTYQGTVELKPGRVVLPLGDS